MNLYIFNEMRRGGAIFGVGTYIRELTAALKDCEIKVCVVNYATEKLRIQKEEIDGIQHWYFPAPFQWTANNPEQWALYYRNIVYLLQLHIKDKKGLIFHLNYMECKPLADALKSVFDCKIVFAVHYLRSVMTLLGNISRLRRIISQPDEPIDAEEISAKNHYLQEKELLQSHGVDKIICLSHHTFELLHHDYQIEKEKMVVIYNGLTDLLPVLDKQTLHLDPDIPMFLFVGRLQEAKGLIYLIKAFRKVLEEFPNCRLIIVGNGNYDTYMREVGNICMNVIFTGLLEKKDLCELYQNTTIGVMPSLTEQCNYVVIEMIMHGLPIVTTNAPGLAEMTEDGISSVQIPVIEHTGKMGIDTALLAEKILYLLNHPNEAKILGANARKRYEKQYTVEVFRKNMLNFYSLLNE